MTNTPREPGESQVARFRLRLWRLGVKTEKPRRGLGRIVDGVLDSFAKETPEYWVNRDDTRHPER